MAIAIDIAPTLIPVSPPIALDADGVARVGQTRVTLESFVAAFDKGCTAEEIVIKYPSLSLGDTYATIAYLLGNESVVREFILTRVAASQPVNDRIGSDFGVSELRARLVARKNAA